MSAFYWLPLACACLHVLEEFAWPGGFSAWYHAYRPQAAASFSPRYALRINALMLAVLAALGAWGAGWNRGPSLWMAMAGLLAGNAVFHLLGAWRTRRYSPGMVTGACLYLPLCVFGVAHLLARGDTVPAHAAFALVLGAAVEWQLRRVHAVRAAFAVAQ